MTRTCNAAYAKSFLSHRSDKLVTNYVFSTVNGLQYSMFLTWKLLEMHGGSVSQGPPGELGAWVVEWTLTSVLDSLLRSARDNGFQIMFHSMLCSPFESEDYLWIRRSLVFFRMNVVRLSVMHVVDLWPPKLVARAAAKTAAKAAVVCGSSIPRGVHLHHMVCRLWAHATRSLGAPFLMMLSIDLDWRRSRDTSSMASSVPHASIMLWRFPIWGWFRLLSKVPAFPMHAK